MGIAEVLTLIFVVFKLIGVITWSWWIVFLPLIIACGFYAIIFVGILVTSLIAWVKVNKKFG